MESLLVPDDQQNKSLVLRWTPGITNVLARAGYDSLETTTDINIGWSGSAADASGIAVISHVFHTVTGEVPMYLDGKLEYVPARQFKREIDFGNFFLSF